MAYLLDFYVLATSLVTIASIICSQTNTPKDDAFLSKYIYPVMEQIAFLNDTAKQKTPTVKAKKAK